MDNNDYIREETVETEKRIGGPSGGYSLPTELKLICCIVPIVGLVMFILNRDEKPLEAREELKWACVGIAIGIGISILTRVSIYAMW